MPMEEIEYHGYLYIIKWIRDNLDGGDLLVINEVIAEEIGHCDQLYIENLVFIECWRII